MTIGETTWARGNIVLKDGRFAIGSPTDFGLFFRFNSIYGLPSDDPKAWMYQNIAYNPDQVTIQWKDMPYDDDSDPCGLADPAGTWRLPTKDEIESLSGTVDFSQPYDYNYGEMNGVFVYKYAEGKLIMPGGGVLYDTYGTGMARYYWKGEGYIRSGTPCYAMKGHLFRDRTTIVELLANRPTCPMRQTINRMPANIPIRQTIVTLRSESESQNTPPLCGSVPPAPSASAFGMSNGTVIYGGFGRQRMRKQVTAEGKSSATVGKC